LMGLLKLYIRRDLAELHQNGVRVRVIGDRQGLQPDIRGLLQEAESLTAGNESLTLIIAFNYGGRDEIVRTARKLAEAVARGDMAGEAITAESFAAALDTQG
ncbi:undecaprenyl diphosphate synthase family protein, partial [Mesorhizobium sp. M1D.F.Ca.ET.234.01.1.1]|uniref:undecaprenyl diphosphate synthase family protein n=1 Tax=Mesorhizobium sp. M1D.F.Ca.ET.234.01.1.1 TaxID=2563932 RepID=UPI00113EB409